MKQVPPEEPLEALVDRFIRSIADRVSSNADGIEDAEYQRVRKILLTHPTVSALVPEFVRSCRDTSDLWRHFKGLELDERQLGTWGARRQYLQEEMEPLRRALEGFSIDRLGDYELADQTPIGTGGFGAVYRYKHRLVGAEFAVKVLNPAFDLGGQEAVARFLQEARILFSLRHQNIVQVHDVGMIGPRPYIRMEFFPGTDLGRVLRNGRVSAHKALAVVREIAGALEHAHQRNVVHRDLKPSNVLVAKPRQLRVIDFGLGVYIENELYSRITRTGDRVAVGHYTAPELVADPRLVDPRSDIYSLGALWYELVTGRPPIGSQIARRLADCDEVGPDYAEAILSCLADLAHRPQTAAAVASSISSLQAALPTAE